MTQLGMRSTRGTRSEVYVLGSSPGEHSVGQRNEPVFGSRVAAHLWLHEEPQTVLDDQEDREFWSEMPDRRRFEWIYSFRTSPRHARRRMRPRSRWSTE
jgi:hypothetical protein